MRFSCVIEDCNVDAFTGQGLMQQIKFSGS
jgi:hypothetical protein